MKTRRLPRVSFTHRDLRAAPPQRTADFPWIRSVQGLAFCLRGHFESMRNTRWVAAARRRGSNLRAGVPAKMIRPSRQWPTRPRRLGASSTCRQPLGRGDRRFARRRRGCQPPRCGEPIRAPGRRPSFRRNAKSDRQSGDPPVVEVTGLPCLAHGAGFLNVCCLADVPVRPKDSHQPTPHAS